MERPFIILPHRMNKGVKALPTAHWTIVDKWKQKQQGQVWRVRDQNGRRGFFKFAYSAQWYDAGPISGNEWLAKQLTDLLSVPSAELELAQVEDGSETLQGIVSLPNESANLLSWNTLPDDVQKNPQGTVRNLKRLVSATIAFDVWVTNIDRASGKNIILYRAADGMYDWYLIDHGYALYGCARKWSGRNWPSRHWQQIWRFYHVPRGWTQLATRSNLMAMAARIQAIPEETLKNTVNGVPDPQYTPAIRNSVIALLFQRRRRLPALLDDWLNYDGNKEYRL